MVVRVSGRAALGDQDLVHGGLGPVSAYARQEPLTHVPDIGGYVELKIRGKVLVVRAQPFINQIEVGPHVGWYVLKIGHVSMPVGD